MEAVLQTWRCDAGVDRADRLRARSGRVGAAVAPRLLYRRGGDGRALAMDAACDQAYQRRAARDRARSGRAADTGADRKMGHAARGAHDARRAGDARFSVGLHDALKVNLAVDTYTYKASLIG